MSMRILFIIFILLPNIAEARDAIVREHFTAQGVQIPTHLESTETNERLFFKLKIIDYRIKHTDTFQFVIREFRH